MEEYIGRMEAVKLEVEQNCLLLDYIFYHINNNPGYTIRSKNENNGVIYEFFHNGVLICSIESYEHILYIEFKELLMNQESWTLLYSSCTLLYEEEVHFKVHHIQAIVYNIYNIEKMNDGSLQIKINLSMSIYIDITESTLERSMEVLRFSVGERIKQKTELFHPFTINLNDMEEWIKSIFKTKDDVERYENA